MTFGRDRLGFVHELVHERHIEDPADGYCLRCAYPRRFHPCPVRRRLIAYLVEIGHLADADRAAFVRGTIRCPCGTVPPYVVVEP